LNLRRVRAKQGYGANMPRLPGNAMPQEMQSEQEVQKKLDLDKAELQVAKAKQAKIDQQNKQMKDIAQAPLTMARDRLNLDQAQTRLAKDSQGTEVERATLGVAQARTANEKEILSIDIERARQAKNIMGELDKGKVSPFAAPHDVAKGMEDAAIAQGGPSPMKNLEFIISAAFKNAADARKAGVEGAMTPGMEEKILQTLGETGRLSAGGAGGTDVSVLRKLFEKGPEALADQFTKRPDLNLDQIAAADDVITKSHDLAISMTELKQAIGTVLATIGTGRPIPGTQSQNYDPGTLPGLAEGGPVHGPGSGTSDSINARLSDGEFVHKTAAVKFWGTDFMHAINNMILPGFADGGSFGGVSIPARFDSSGMQPGGMGTVNLHLDGRTFEGLRAPNALMRELSHYAIGRLTSQTGRKPSWVE
jgi:hypothetical protein